MKSKLKRCESILWLVIKLCLYIILMATFMLILSRENRALIKPSRTMGITLSTFVVVGLLFVSIYGRYDVGRRKSKPIIYSMSLAVIFTDIITYIQLMVMNTITPSVYALRFVSIKALILTMIGQIVIIVIFVYAGNALFFTIHTPEKCYVVTSSQEALDEIVRGILKFKKQYRIVGILDYRDTHVLEKLKDADTVFLYDVPIFQRSEITNFCYKTRKNVYFNPEIEDIVEMTSEYYLLDDISVLNYNVKGLTMEQRIIKRCIDIAGSLVMGIVSSPIWIVSAIAIKVYDGGSILFKQKRATINGTVFEVYKFRTMTDERDAKGNLLPDEQRLTEFGKFLRESSLDELPELFNILKGDMSIVGPRPQLVRDMVFMTKEQRRRHKVTQGLTGLAQVSGRNNISWEEKLAYDQEYVKHITFLGDLKIIFKTIGNVLKKEDINTDGMATAEDFGDYLLRTGQVDQETYDRKQRIARKICEKNNQRG